MRDHVRAAWGSGLVLVAAASGALGASLRGTSPLDAGYVSARYARNLAAGDGLVFNLGERAEGFGDPLWTVLLGLLGALGVSPIEAAVVLGVVCLALCVLLTGWIGTRLLGEGPGVACALMLAAWPPVALAARSTDDVLFQSVFVLWSVGLVVGEIKDGTRSCWTLAALSLTALTGLLGAVLALVLAGLGALRRPERACRLVWICGVLSTLTLARWVYFSDPIPSHTRALPWGGLGRWEDGGAWLLQLLREAPMLAGLGLVGTLWALLRRTAWAAAGVAVLLALILVVGTAPARVLLWHPLVPVVGLLVLLGVGLVAQLTRAPLPSRLLLVVLLCGFGAQDFRVAHVRAEKVNQARRGRFVQARALGRFLELRFPDNEVLAMHKPGVIGQYTDNPIIDLTGRTDRAMARAPRRILREAGKPARSDIAGVMDRDPVVFVHPRAMTGALPGRIRPPPWFPDGFDDHYASVALSSRKHWGLSDVHPIWLFFFLRSGLKPAPDWLKNP